MVTEVAVLYDDLNVIRVPWNKKRSLQTNQVLAIAILHSDRKRNQCSILHDYYQLVWTDDDCCLTGHDGDYGFYNLHTIGVDWRFPFIMPQNCIEFEGIYVSKEDWQKALLIYADPGGGMF